MPKTITIRHQIGFHAEMPIVHSNHRPLAIGTIQPGAIIPIVQVVEGLEFEKELTFSNARRSIKKIVIKSNKWHQDKNGWWYWDGATRTLEEAETGSTTGLDSMHDATVPPTAAPEKTFEWKSILKFSGAVPPSWFKHSGKGLNIAILDSGFNLQNPALRHLKNKAKTYDLRNYNNLHKIKDKNFVQNLSGKDKLPGGIHGTSCLSILAANHPQKEIVGLIPDANYHLFNVYEHRTAFGKPVISRSETLIQKAMWMISNMDMDIVSVSVNYPNNSSIPDDLIGRMVQNNTLWFWALNTATSPSLDKYILNPSYPSPFIPIHTVGTLKKNQLEFPDSLIVTEMEQEKIDFIIQENTISVVCDAKEINHKASLQCSFANPAIAGLAALKINEIKKNRANFQMNPKTFMPEFKREATRFYRNFIPVDDAFSFLRLTENPLV